MSKAYTAAVIRIPTHTVGELAQPGAPLYGIQHTHNGKIILFGGGYPLCIGGKVVGAIGVSGGTVEQDMLVAEPAVQMLQFIECWAKEIRPLLPHVNGNGSWTALPGGEREAFESVQRTESADSGEHDHGPGGWSASGADVGSTSLSLQAYQTRLLSSTHK